MTQLMILFCLSPICTLIGVVWLVKLKISKKYSSTSRKLCIFSLSLVLTIFIMHLLVSVYQVHFVHGADGEQNGMELISASIIHTLQSFSMDASYGDYIADAKSMLAAYFGSGSPWVTAYTVFIALTNVAAPVSGGAILFDILTTFIPELRLFVVLPFRKKYYFSELNERSLALAESIYSRSRKSFLKPVLIFTDAYVDEDDELKSELLIAAKAIGAICVKSDLRYTLKQEKNTYVFLIDQNETDNLKTLITLTDKKHYQTLKNAFIYIFCEKGYTSSVEREVHSKLERFFYSKWKNYEKNMPIIISVKSYQNMICNLFNDVPLFEPFLTNNPIPYHQEKKLVLTIIGSGKIGTEAFLTATWCAQMLDTELVINVISKETEEEFCSRIDFVNPDILESTKERSKLLRIYKHREDEQAFAAPYFRFQYFRSDLVSQNTDELLGEKLKVGGTLFDTDYFIVTLGADDINISFADKLRTAIERKALGHLTDSESTYKKKIIAYAVYDKEISDSLNNADSLRSSSVGGNVLECCKPCMYAFGNIKELYGAENVFMSIFEDMSDQLAASYQERKEALVDTDKEKFREKTDKRYNDEYNYSSNNARAVHQPYKMYSAGILTESVFDDHCCFRHKSDYEALIYRFYQFLTDKEEFSQEKKDIIRRLTWLEHRRWNAFIRVQGLRHATDDEHETFFKLTGKHKDLSAKLHNCLVESSDKEFEDVTTLYHDESELDENKHDLLDYESFKAHSYYKSYDMPVAEIKITMKK